MHFCPPPSLRHLVPFVSRRRALRRVAYAVAMGAVLILPSALSRSRPAPVLAAMTPPVVEEGTADLGADDFMLTAGRLPEKFPDGWRKPPLPQGEVGREDSRGVLRHPRGNPAVRPGVRRRG